MIWERQRKYFLENKELIYKRNKGYKLRHKYGISEEEFNALVKVQKGLCAICNKEKKLCVDHNHSSREVRGLLCQLCNSAIGYFDESEETLTRAVEYLRSNK